MAMRDVTADSGDNLGNILRHANENFKELDNKNTKQDDEIKTIKSRIITFEALPEGSTILDAEIADGRVGIDGTIYRSLGESIREQMRQVNPEYAIPAELTARLDDLEAEITDARIATDLETEYSSLGVAVRSQLSTLSDSVSETQTQMEELNTSVGNSLEEFQENMSQSMSDLESNVNKSLGDLSTSINEELDDAKTGIDGTKYNSLGEAIRQQIESFSSSASSEELEKVVNEVSDARTGADSVTYDSLGQALRTQLGNINDTTHSLETRLEDLNDSLAGLDLSIEPDDLGLEQDEETNVLYPTYKGTRSNNGIMIVGGGGGGGSSSYVCRLLNATGSSKLSIPSNQPCIISYEFYEYYESQQTPMTAIAKISVRSGLSGSFTEVKMMEIDQGLNSIDMSEFLKLGANYVKIQVTGGESGIAKTITLSVNIVDLSLTSTFSDTSCYTSSIPFLYRVTGKNLTKTMHFYVDDAEYKSVDIGTAHNTQLSEILNLSSYGHGHHMLKVYFTTAEGAKSPELLYDVIYSDGVSEDPIIASTFQTKQVSYGENIVLNYVVFTNGSEFTQKVKLEVYSLDSEGNEVIFNSNTLLNVINQSIQTWSITDYPSKDGTLYLRITAGPTVRVFTVEVSTTGGGDRDLSSITTRLIAAISSSGRNNNDINRDSIVCNYTSKDDITTQIKGTLKDFNYRSNGWLLDEKGFPVLRISGNSQVDIDLPFFATNWTDENNQEIALSGSPTKVGRTFEILFKTDKVTDESKEIFSLFDDVTGIGIKIFPSKAYILSDSMGITTDENGVITNKNAIPYVPYSSSLNKVKLSFVIEQKGYYQENDGTEKQLIRLYVNGQLAKAVIYSNDDFTTKTAKPVIKASNCILDVYSMRFYDYALDDYGIRRNYIADLPSLTEKIEVYDKNAIVNDDDEIDFRLSIKQYVCMVLTGELSRYKGDKVKIGVELYKPDGSSELGYYLDWDYMEQLDGKYGNVNNVQGTSSQYYLKKNYKITFYKLVDGAFKKCKVEVLPNRIPVNTICIKADYMSPDNANLGNANYWQSIIREKTPPQEIDERYQTSIMGYPMMVFQRLTANETPTFIGRYCLNNDKSNSEAFGLINESDNGNDTVCQKWEYLDNSEDICNWKTDRLFANRTDKDGQTYPAWMDALESTYPDQGDLEDEGLTPNLDILQMHYSWVVQRANYLDASTRVGTGGEYNGYNYETERDLKFAIFKNEFTKHFNLYHTIHYFIANEVPLMVDNLSKNFFATVYNTKQQRILNLDGEEIEVSSLISNDGFGVVDISNVDWINSEFDPIYPTLYDMDSCLGADNNGFDQFPYYAEMWDSYNGSKIVNGSENLFWRLFYNAFYTDYLAQYKTFRDTDKSLSANIYRKAMIDDVTSVLPIVAVNKDQKFKYIDAYEGGYFDYETNKWIYTSSFMYLVKSTMESYHSDFITKRMNMLDSKAMVDSYKQDNFNLRVNRGQSLPEDLAFSITPCQALYCYTEWGNSGAYVGGKCLENESIEMKPTSAGNWNDIVLAIYGASHLKSLGDLSVLYPSKLQSLSLCQNLTELILGSQEPGYNNPLLTNISDISYLSMLKKLNICNLTALSGTIDLSNCDLIEEFYASGSAISAIVFPEGGYLKYVSLPNSITSINVINHNELIDFSMDSYSGIVRLRVENSPNVPIKEILKESQDTLSRLRLTDIDITLEDDSILKMLIDPSMQGKGIDAIGNNIEDESYPVITGIIHVNRVQKSVYRTLQLIYPNLVIDCANFYHVVNFLSEGEIISTVEVEDGGTAVAPVLPNKVNTVEKIYYFRSWDKPLTNISRDHNINAQYESGTQTYTIEFYENTESVTPYYTSKSISYTTGSYSDHPSAPYPTKDGCIFAGYLDEFNNVYDLVSQFPYPSTRLDNLGNPLPIKLYSHFEPIEFPSTSKQYSELTEGERLFCATVIQRGTYKGCTATYSDYENSCVIVNSDRTISVKLAVGDSDTFKLEDGTEFKRRVIGFNHDFIDQEELSPAGITYESFYAYPLDSSSSGSSQTRPSIPLYNYTFGTDEPKVSTQDFDPYSSVSDTDSRLTYTREVTQEEAALKKVVMTINDTTVLSKLTVKHYNEDTITWYFDYRGVWLGEDQSPQYTWYLDDFSSTEETTFYKIGKLLHEAGCSPMGLGSFGTSGSSFNDAWQVLNNKRATLSGGLIIDTTKSCYRNTERFNPYVTNGKSSVIFSACTNNNYGNTTVFDIASTGTFFSGGTVITIPVQTGDTIIVETKPSFKFSSSVRTPAYNFLETEIYPKFPIKVKNSIVPVYKREVVSSYTYLTQSECSTLWMLSTSELGGVADTNWWNSLQFDIEGNKYNIYSTNNSRVKYYPGGNILSGCNWATRSLLAGYPYGNSILSIYIKEDGSFNYNAYQYNVSFGFCSGLGI